MSDRTELTSPDAQRTIGFTRRVALSLALSLLAALGCTRDPDVERLVITGSSTIAPLASEIARRFEAEHPNVRVDVQMGGSSRGMADARSGLAHIGMVSRALATDEADLVAHPIARDGVCLIVHADNPVPALTDDQVRAIYRGQARSWAAMGGADGHLTVVNKAEGRSTLEVFQHHFALKSTDIRPDVVIGDNEQGIRTVAGNPGAIGYVSIGAAEQAVRAGVPIRALPMSGEAIARTLNLVTADEPTGLTRRFIDYARSQQVHDLIRQQFFVPFAP